VFSLETLLVVQKRIAPLRIFVRSESKEEEEEEDYEDNKRGQNATLKSQETIEGKSKTTRRRNRQE
jgi:hypothetical protein